MVFAAGMTVYYSLHYGYHKAPSEAMRNIPDTRSYRDGDVRWLWAALMPGLDREAVRASLPPQYQRGAWGDFYSGILCHQGQRNSLDDMWASLKALMPSIGQLPEPGV